MNYRLLSNHLQNKFLISTNDIKYSYFKIQQSIFIFIYILFTKKIEASFSFISKIIYNIRQIKNSKKLNIFESDRISDKIDNE